VDEPTFIAKSSALRRFLGERLAELTSNSSHSLSTQLTFLMGFDTLERVLAPRYYPSEDEMHRLLDVLLSPAGDDSRIVCARRFIDGRDGEIDALPGAGPYLESGWVAGIDIGRSEMSMSSSALRAQRRSGDQLWATATTPEIRRYIVDHNLYHSI